MAVVVVTVVVTVVVEVVVVVVEWQWLWQWLRRWPTTDFRQRTGYPYHRLVVVVVGPTPLPRGATGGDGSDGGSDGDGMTVPMRC